MNLKKHIPNTLTCCNLLSGCAATYFAFQQDFPLSMLLIVVGAAFDFFDGFAARLLHVSSPIGKELDSLADDITFGFAPAAMVFGMLQQLVSPANMPEGCPFAPRCDEALPRCFESAPVARCENGHSVACWAV